MARKGGALALYLTFAGGSGAQVYAKTGAHDGQTLGYIDPGDWAAYNGMDLTGVTTFKTRVVSGGPGGTIQVRADSLSETILGSVAVPNTGGWNTFADVQTALSNVPAGVHNLYLTFTGIGTGLFDADDFTLIRGTGTGTGPIVGLANKCLDVAGGATADGTKVQLYSCSASAARQTWTRDGQIWRALGKCIDVAGAGISNGTKVQRWTCNTSGAQNWVAAANGSLVNPNSGKCLDVAGSNSADGTQIVIWTCLGGPNQRWTTP